MTDKKGVLMIRHPTNRTTGRDPFWVSNMNVESGRVLHTDSVYLDDHTGPVAYRIDSLYYHPNSILRLSCRQ